MKVFITGASGYIGGSLAAVLQKEGHRVRGLTRSEPVAKQLTTLGIEPVIGELDDAQLLTHEAAEADLVINTANADHRGAVEALRQRGLRGLGLRQARALRRPGPGASRPGGVHRHAGRRLGDQARLGRDAGLHRLDPRAGGLGAQCRSGPLTAASIQ